MSLALVYPDQPDYRVPRFRVALRVRGEWDWKFEQRPAAARLMPRKVSYGPGGPRAEMVVDTSEQSEAGVIIRPELGLEAIDGAFPHAEACIWAQPDRPEKQTGASFLWHGLLDLTRESFDEDSLSPVVMGAGLLDSLDMQPAGQIAGRWLALTTPEDAVSDWQTYYCPAWTCVFNEGGLPNRASELQMITTSPFSDPIGPMPAFADVNDESASWWRICDVLYYLLKLYIEPAMTASGLAITDGNVAARIVAAVTNLADPLELDGAVDATFEQAIQLVCPPLVAEGPEIGLVGSVLPLLARAGNLVISQVTLNEGGEPKSKLVIWQRGEGGPFANVGSAEAERELLMTAAPSDQAVRELRLGAVGTKIDEGPLPQVRRGEVLYDAHRVLSAVQVLGDVERWQVRVGGGRTGGDRFLPLWVPDTFFGDDLFGDAADEAILRAEGSLDPATAEGDELLAFTNYDRRGEDFREFATVGRVWGLNEAGDFLPSVYGRNESSIWNPGAYAAAYDWHAAAGVAVPWDPDMVAERRWIPRRRAVLDLLGETGTADSSRPILEISFDSGVHWYPYAGSYRFCGPGDVYGLMFGFILDDANLAGVLNPHSQDDDQAPDHLWAAIILNTVVFRLTAGVEGDVRVCGRATRGQTWGLKSRRQTMRARPRTLRREQYAHNIAGRIETPRDDAPRAVSMAAQMLAARSARQISATVELPFPTTDWLPGDLCRGIYPRGMSWQVIPGGEDRFPELVACELHLAAQGAVTVLTFDDLRSSWSPGRLPERSET